MAKKNSLITAVAGQKATDFALNRAVDQHGNPTPAFQKVVLKALDVQRPLVLRYLHRMHRRHPDATPAELAERMGKQYLNAVTGGGAAIGGTAVVPGVGTAAALGLSAAATVAFLEASALYAQSVAELMGITTDDPKRSQTLVMAVMLGEDGRSLLRDLTSHANGTSVGPLGGALSAVSGASGVSDAVFRQISRMFMKRFIVRQGAGMVGRLVPFGVGAVVGGVANRALGKGVVKGAQDIFGAMPPVLPVSLMVELKALTTGKDKALTSGKGKALTSGKGKALTSGKGKGKGKDREPDADDELRQLLEEDVREDIVELRADGTLAELQAEDPEAFAAEVEAARAEHLRRRSSGE